MRQPSADFGYTSALFPPAKHALIRVLQRRDLSESDKTELREALTSFVVRCERRVTDVKSPLTTSEVISAMKLASAVALVDGLTAWQLRATVLHLALTYALFWVQLDKRPPVNLVKQLARLVTEISALARQPLTAHGAHRLIETAALARQCVEHDGELRAKFAALHGLLKPAAEALELQRYYNLELPSRTEG